MVIVNTEDPLEHRYGAPPSAVRRWTTRALIAALALAGVTWLGWAAYHYSLPDVTSQLRAYEVRSEHSASALLRVRVHGDETATCRVRAFAEDHSVVGEATIEVAPGEDDDYTIDVRTERRATSVDKVGCTTPSQPRPR